MPKFGQFTKSIVVRFENLLDQVENHEAAAEVAIRELQEDCVSVRRRHLGAQHELRTLRDRADDLERFERSWKERAARVDDPRALACVKRMLEARAGRERLLEQIGKQETLERRLHDDLQLLDERLQTLKRRRAELVSRSAQSRAAQALEAEDDSVFDRWEARVAQAEVGVKAGPDVDPLDARLTEEEREAAAVAELQRLRAEKVGGS